jgi:hypothetical protein
MTASRSSLQVVRKRRSRSIGAYDALTLILEECETLTGHLADRLQDAADRSKERYEELHALMLIAEHLRREKLQLVRRHAAALLEQVQDGIA